MKAFGIIFANIHDNHLPEMTRRRTIGSVPFGCRYRLIDFALSNLVNANIDKVGVITHYNYQSLMDHIGTGKDWDLARRSGGIKLLPPYITAYDNTQGDGLENSRLHSLKGILNFITRSTEEYAVLTDCDAICNINIDDVMKSHVKNEADITIVAKRMLIQREDVGKQILIEADNNSIVTDVMEQTSDLNGEKLVSTNIIILKRELLQSMVLEALSHNYRHLYMDSIKKHIGTGKVMIYEHKGYYATIKSIVDYYRCSMELLDTDTRNSLFSVEHSAIYTKVRNSTPTKYESTAIVENSLIADGCTIEGTVKNSILFRGVKIGKGTVVENSIMLQDTYTGENVHLNCVITDKNVVIRDGRKLSGHETMPFYIDKGAMI